jgi:bacillithiol biosynthesis cysteine-adding enzyme BshC
VLDNSVSTAARVLPVDIRRFPWTSRLASDYIYAFDALAPFYAGNPADAAAWRGAIARAQQHPRQRERIAAILEAQQRRRGAPSNALAASASLADPRTVAVVTGQQAGLFGGPLFTLLKALTAIRQARRIRTEHGVAAVAIFWVHGEDHDWDEIKGCRVLDADSAPRDTEIARAGAAGGPTAGPIARVTLDASVERAVAALEQALQPTEFTAGVLASLRAHYAPGIGMADAFARWIEALLGQHGLIVFDGSDAAAKPLAAELFAREIERGDAARLAGEASRRLESAGYHAQVAATEASRALFDLTSGRDPIRPPSPLASARQAPPSEPPGDVLVAGSRVESVAEMAARARTAPQEFSPNVLLRPVTQDTLFPTVCYVGGPAEVAYYGQLRGVYDAFGVPMPLVMPRATATVIDANAFRFLTKYDVPLESLSAQDEATLNTLLESQLPPSVEAAVDEARRALDATMTAVAGELPRVDPTREGAARSTLARMQDDLTRLQAKVVQAAKRKNATLRRQFTHAQAQTFPGGKPQERALGLVYFLNKYGPSFVDRMADDMPADMGTHAVIAL